MTGSSLRVAEVAIWDELERITPLGPHTAEALGPTERRMRPSFDRDVMPALAARGVEVSVRWARRTPAQVESAHQALAQRIAGLSRGARAVLFRAQRHALDGWVAAAAAWDPENERPAVRELLGAELLQTSPHGPDRFLLNPELPPPPATAYDFAEAAMELPDDLGPERDAHPIALLHDVASLAAAIEAVRPKRTGAGTIGAADRRKLASALASPGLASAPIEEDARWGKALRALEALRVVSVDPIQRTIDLDLGLDETLSGSTEEALDRLIHKLVDPDLHSAVPAVRSALRDAGAGAVDEVVFLDLLFEQHRDVLVTPWQGARGPVYPALPGELQRAWDRDGYDHVEGPLLSRLMSRLERLGLVRRAPGVFAATAEGRRWADPSGTPLPPVWVSSDLEIVVPPDGLTPWERFQVERLGRCLARDVVDRYKLERAGLVRWLRHHDLDEAMALLRRRSPGVPASAVETLESWAVAANRIVLTVG